MYLPSDKFIYTGVFEFPSITSFTFVPFICCLTSKTWSVLIEWKSLKLTIGANVNMAFLFVFFILYCIPTISLPCSIHIVFDISVPFTLYVYTGKLSFSNFS